jgi:hypothetical protein
MNQNHFTPYPVSRYKPGENIEFIEGVEYFTLEKIPILEETQEEKPNLNLQVNILAAKNLLKKLSSLLKRCN